MSETTFTVDKDNLEVRTERTFKATPERLWEAYADSEQVAKWWGPRRYPITVEANEIRVGGKWRFIQSDSDGNTAAFSGEFKEVDEPNKLVSTFSYEPMPGHELLQTVTFTPDGDGMTKVVATAKYANIEDLEGMVSMGMESGQRESMDRLIELIEAA